jgi:hypothetical protein
MHEQLNRTKQHLTKDNLFLKIKEAPIPIMVGVLTKIVIEVPLGDTTIWFTTIFEELHKLFRVL